MKACRPEGDHTPLDIFWNAAREQNRATGKFIDDDVAERKKERRLTGIFSFHGWMECSNGK